LIQFIVYCFVGVENNVDRVYVYISVTLSLNNKANITINNKIIIPTQNVFL